MQPMSLDDLKHMRQLVAADSYWDVAQALTKLHVIADGRAVGQPRIADWRMCGDLFADWFTVAVGEKAETFWKARDSGKGRRSPHLASWCSFCEEACVHGPCEHQYAGLLVAGLLSSTQPSASSRRKRSSRKAAVRAPAPGCGHGVVEHPAVLVAERTQDPREIHSQGGHAADVCQF